MTNAQNCKSAVILEDRKEGLNIKAMLCITFAVNRNVSFTVYNRDLTDGCRKLRFFDSNLCLTFRI